MNPYIITADPSQKNITIMTLDITKRNQPIEIPAGFYTE